VIGKIQRLALREVWKHAALDFTTWLEGNADALGEALGLPLSNASCSRSTAPLRIS